jgi:hypothetical protein
MPYSTARARLRKALGRVAGGDSVVGIIDVVFGDVA